MTPSHPLDVHVRPATASDVPRLGRLGAMLVAMPEERGDVVGYAFATLEGYDYMSLRGPAGVLQDIIVDPASRGRGVGRKLLEATLARLGAGGAPRVILSTAEQNLDAQHLFASMGFRRTMIEMTRELAAAGGDGVSTPPGFTAGE